MVDNETWAPSLLSHNMVSVGWNGRLKKFNGAYFDGIKAAVKQNKIDFINLQQLSINSPTQRFLNELIKGYSRPLISIEGRGNGLMTFYRKGAFILEEETVLKRGFSMALVFRKIDTRERITVINSYSNAHHQLDIIEEEYKVIEDYIIKEGLNNNREETLLFSGDINLDMNNFEKHKRHRRLYDRFLQRTGLTDVLAAMGNEDTTYRGNGENANRVGRLDVILSNRDNIWKETDLLTTPTSDHKILLLLANPTIKAKTKTEIKWNPTMFDRDTFIDPALEIIAETLYMNIDTTQEDKVDYGERDKKKLIKSFDEYPEIYDHLEYKNATMLFLIITKIKEIHDKQIKNSKKSKKGVEVKFQKRIKELWKKIDEGDEEGIYKQELDQLRKERKRQLEEAISKGQKYRTVQKVINTGSNNKFIVRAYDKRKKEDGGA